MGQGLGKSGSAAWAAKICSTTCKPKMCGGFSLFRQLNTAAGGRVALAVVGHLDGQHAVRRIRPDGDMHGDCIVADSVVQKVFDGRSRASSADHRVFCAWVSSVQGCCHAAAFVKFGRHRRGTADRPALRAKAVRRIAAVVKFKSPMSDRIFSLWVHVHRGFLPGCGRRASSAAVWPQPVQRQRRGMSWLTPAIQSCGRCPPAMISLRRELLAVSFSFSAAPGKAGGGSCTAALG